MTISMAPVPFSLISKIPWGDMDMKGCAPESLIASVLKVHSEAPAVPSTEVAAEVPEPEVAAVPDAAPVEEVAHDLPVHPQFMGLYSAILARIERRKNPAPAEEAKPAEAVHEEAKAPVTVVQKFRVMSRSFDEKGLHGASYLTEVGKDGKPKEVPTQCPLKVVLRYLKETRRSQYWLWAPLEKSPNMHSLKRTTVLRKGEKMSLWDALVTDTNQKVSGLFEHHDDVNKPKYWDEVSGEWVGYYLERA